MSDSSGIHGLGCPRCGGMIPIPEGQNIVICPFCDLRSVISGEKGVRRYQVPCQISAEQAQQSFRKFLSGNMAIAGNLVTQAKIQEVFLVHLPFWAGWGRVLGWVFGQEKVRNDKTTTYRPKEVKIAEEMNWNSAACEVGEFGVKRIRLEGRPLQPFQPDDLHRSGMVFEAVGSASEAMHNAETAFEATVSQKAKLDKISQSTVRIVRPHLGLVYYPMWVVRYHYRERSFQVAIDGYNGEILYGKTPGNTLYRAAVLVVGMALGSFISVDVSALLLLNSDSSDEILFLCLGAFIFGIGLMITAYRKYRYGEHYEYLRDKGVDPGGISFDSLGNLTDKIKQISDWVGS